MMPLDLELVNCQANSPSLADNSAFRAKCHESCSAIQSIGPWNGIRWYAALERMQD